MHFDYEVKQYKDEYVNGSDHLVYLIVGGGEVVTGRVLDKLLVSSILLLKGLYCLTVCAGGHSPPLNAIFLISCHLYISM